MVSSRAAKARAAATVEKAAAKPAADNEHKDDEGDGGDVNKEEDAAGKQELEIAKEESTREANDVEAVADIVGAEHVDRHGAKESTKDTAPIAVAAPDKQDSAGDENETVENMKEKGSDEVGIGEDGSDEGNDQEQPTKAFSDPEPTTTGRDTSGREEGNGPAPAESATAAQVSVKYEKEEPKVYDTASEGGKASEVGVIGVEGNDAATGEKEEETQEEDEEAKKHVSEEALSDEDDSSDEEDGDGFRIVVGREAAPPASAAAPTKRFLRGTNTLVNAMTTSSTGAVVGDEEARTTSASKPVSAAAGIASLVPSKGAPVASSRPSLKPGEYPPTAELQQSAGKTAFDVDIDGMEEQPWRHPGVDVADFFNYGFTEDSWRVYCEKQLRNRYDRSFGRSTNTSANNKGIGGRGGITNHARHGGVIRRGAERPGGPEPSIHARSKGLPGPNFSLRGPAGNKGWVGPGPGPERFAQGFGPGPPPGGIGHGNAPVPRFDISPQARQGNWQNPGVGQSSGLDRGGGMLRQNNGVRDGLAGATRSRSPNPRDGQSDKIARVR